MIIVKLWGGMCNQMFQYAFGYTLAKRKNDDLFFDIDFYNNQPGYVGKRKVIGKEQFNIGDLQFKERKWWIKLFENKYLNHLIRYHGGCNLSVPNGGKMIIETYHKFYDMIPYSPGKVNFYDGYWQTERYFKDFRDELVTMFKPNPEVLEKIKSWKNSLKSDKCVAVHVRRGDYLNSINQKSLGNANVIGDINYYRKAMDLMIEKLKTPLFCFFSDDINWCKENFAGKYDNLVFVENTGKDAALLDLFSISVCEHGIMSPSTFSWWGNWLRDNGDESFVICPKGDVGNEYFTCQNWIQL